MLSISNSLAHEQTLHHQANKKIRPPNQVSTSATNVGQLIILHLFSIKNYTEKKADTCVKLVLPFSLTYNHHKHNLRCL